MRIGTPSTTSSATRATARVGGAPSGDRARASISGEKSSNGSHIIGFASNHSAPRGSSTPSSSTKPHQVRSVPSRHDDNVILSEACTLWASVADDQVVIAMKLSPGSRLRSPVCDTEVIFVRSGDEDIDLRCGGQPIVPLDGEPPDDL